MKERNIPLKNYLILAIILVGTFGLTLYASSWYKAIREYDKNNSVLIEVLNEIEIETLSSYLQDNPEAAIYVSSSKDETIKGFEKTFKKVIVEENLNNEIIFLDISKAENINALNSIKDNYFPENLKKMENIYIPNIIYFNEGKVSDILYIKSTEINKNDVIKFLKRVNLIEND